jgi:hypothetical protein
MSAFSDLYVSRVLAIPTSGRGLDSAARRWRWLRTALFDPYRPEQHYTRGPGPKGARSFPNLQGPMNASSTICLNYSRSYSGTRIASSPSRTERQ